MLSKRTGRWSVVLGLASFLSVGCGTGGSATVNEPAGRTAPQPVVSDTTGPTTKSVFPRGYEIWPANPPTRGPAPAYDILHGSLDLSFDYEVPVAIGLVSYELVVLRNAIRDLRFRSAVDGVGEIDVSRKDIAIRSEHRIDGDDLHITTSAPLRRGDTLTVTIRFRTGSTAGESRVGIRFVDPADRDPSIPTQIWCCGDVSPSDVWLPGPDSPGERMTFTLDLNVPDSLTTLASGELTDQRMLAEGIRTDHWMVAVPQPPFRLGFAVGRFSLIGDEYVSPVGKRSQLTVAVDPHLEHLADAVFAPTREMVQVVERRTAVEYPFADYTQVVVHELDDGWSSAATLSMFDASILRDGRALLDATGESEMMRGVASQWYGGWIGIADRSDMNLVNGFGRLFEAFYREDAYGRRGMEEELLRIREDYFAESARVRRPVIFRDSTDPRYGASAIEKSALALYQLGGVIGDETWWRAVRDFTARSGWRAATLDDFRDSAEHAARRTLNRYFDEWFLQPGHPELLVDHDYAPGPGLYRLRIRQVQDSLAFPTYELETDVLIQFETGSEYRERVRISSRDTTLLFGVGGRVLFARLDRDRRLLADIREHKPPEQWQSQAEYDAFVAGRYDAVKVLSDGVQSVGKRDVLMRVAAEDPSPMVRTLALTGLTRYAQSGVVLRFLFDRSRMDSDAACRSMAIRVLGNSGDPSTTAVLRRALEDPSYEVVSEAVSALGRVAPRVFWSTVESLIDVRSWNSVVEVSILEVLGELPTPAAESYIRHLLEPANPARVRLAALTAFRAYAVLGSPWDVEVEALAQSLLSDPNLPVRNLARRIIQEW